MPQPLSDLDSSAFDAGGVAFFLDFDGTLAEFVDDPAAVILPQQQKRALEALKNATDSALAIVSGRQLADLELLIAPLDVPLAGVHGLERRKADGHVVRVPVDEAGLMKARSKLRTFALGHSGILAEEKPGSVALHYRKRPELEAACMALARSVANSSSGLKLLHGKMVLEIKAGQATKADAIQAFMEEPPFRGRQPIFAGDDTTDEDAFPAVEALGGISIKVGPGHTSAAYRAADIHAFRGWLDAIASRFSTSTSAMGGIDGHG